MALSAHCCWCCSVCARGELKPPGGGDGWKKGRGRKRGLDSVMTRLSTVVTEAAERLGVLLTPRNLLQDETEKTTLLHGLIEVLLPTIPGMEECMKCCDHCYKNGTQRLDDPQFLIQSINKACGEMVARLPDAGKPAAAAAAAAAPPSPALSPVAEMVGEAEPKRKRAGLGERDANAQDASPAAPPQLDRAGDENDSSVAAVQQQKQLKVAAQHAKSKEKKRREKYQATVAVREEQNSELSQRIMELTAENDRLHSFSI